MIKREDIKNMGSWAFDPDRLYDYIYIVPTKQKMWEYKMAYYLWQIWDEIKIINQYDCWAIWSFTDSSNYIRFDFELSCAWLKLWNWRGWEKLKYKFDTIVCE